MEVEKHVELGVNISNFVRYKVLIVDSSKADRANLKRILLRRQFQILGEERGHEQLLMLLNNLYEKPDLLMVDFGESYKEGVQVIKDIREAHPKIKIIITTNNMDKDTIKELISLRINSFILKPFNNDKIVDKLAKILGRNEFVYNKEIIINKKTYVNLNDIKIPPMSSVTLRVMAFDTDNPEVGIADLEKIVVLDKAITTGIIRLANSSFYGRSGKIHTIHDAMTLLGIKTVKNLVFLLSRKKLSNTLKDKVFVKFIQELPVITSLVSFDIAVQAGMKRLAEQVFLSALLRKIGMTILALNCDKNYQEALKIFEFGVKSLYEIEDEKFAVNSIQMGLKVFKFWNMPEMFLNIIENQNFSIDEMDSVTEADRITRLAEILTLKVLGVKITVLEQEIGTRLIEKYKVSKYIDEMFSGNYYEIIKDHPIYSFALG
ncbi:MAG: HDOD domain-containing protein [Leptospiraceae bacterium]|nr:HDOD domain-containing protein [Leptospiraceae bacterium]MCP5497915.1 HDOD domain-containing protein [Leptospiraceae bacterium]